MFCPQCGAEFREGFDRCADCDVPLVSEPPPEPPEPSHEAPEYETVLATSEMAAIPVVKSLLDSAGIPYTTQGESRIFPMMSEGLSLCREDSPGQVLVRVPKDRAEEAHQLLEQEAEIVDAQEQPASNGDQP
ncbi:MAG: DUF2007 domain-containing protein [bacterium]|nr:DUF2007 domain-containing protein [bacterium]